MGRGKDREVGKSCVGGIDGGREELDGGLGVDSDVGQSEALGVETGMAKVEVRVRKGEEAKHGYAKREVFPPLSRQRRLTGLCHSPLEDPPADNQEVATWSVADHINLHPGRVGWKLLQPKARCIQFDVDIWTYWG